MLIGAGILAARKLAQHDGGRRVPATVAAISDAVRWAEEIMNEIDHRRPETKVMRVNAVNAAGEIAMKYHWGDCNHHVRGLW